MAHPCNSRSAVAPDFLPNVPNDVCENDEEDAVGGVLTVSWSQLSPTLATVPRGGLWPVQRDVGSTCGDELIHRLSASS